MKHLFTNKIGWRWKKLILPALVFVLVLSLTACGTLPVGSVLGGECKLVQTAEYQVKGKTKYDQDYVDDTTERLVAGCGQARPKARPASFDRPAPKARVTSPVPMPPAKSRWWQWPKQPESM